MHFGTFFQHGKARIQTEVQTAICTRRTIDRLSGKLRRKGPADPNPPCANTRSRYLFIIIHNPRKNRGVNFLLCINVATPLAALVSDDGEVSSVAIVLSLTLRLLRAQRAVISNPFLLGHGFTSLPVDWVFSQV